MFLAVIQREKVLPKAVSIRAAELLRADTHRHSKLSTADCSGCARPGSFCNSRLEAF